MQRFGLANGRNGTYMRRPSHPPTRANPPSARQHRAARRGKGPCKRAGADGGAATQRTGTHAGQCARRGWAGLGRTTEKGTATNLRGHNKEAQARVRSACGKVVFDRSRLHALALPLALPLAPTACHIAARRCDSAAAPGRGTCAEAARLAAVVGWRAGGVQISGSAGGQRDVPGRGLRGRALRGLCSRDTGRSVMGLVTHNPVTAEGGASVRRPQPQSLSEPRPAAAPPPWSDRRCTPSPSQSSGFRLGCSR